MPNQQPTRSQWIPPHPQELHDRLSRAEWYLEQHLTHFQSVSDRTNIQISELRQEVAAQIKEVKVAFEEDKEERRKLVSKLMITVLSAVGTFVIPRLFELLTSR